MKNPACVMSIHELLACLSSSLSTLEEDNSCSFTSPLCSNAHRHRHVEVLIAACTRPFFQIQLGMIIFSMTVSAQLKAPVELRDPSEALNNFANRAKKLYTID